MSNQTKKTPIGTKLMMETKEYLENKEALNKRINHNSVFANTLLTSVGTNLIDFEHRKEVFRNWDKKACKLAKSEWKNNKDLPSHNKERSELVALVIEYSRKGYPHYEAKLSVLN